ncbi:thioredoxin-like protein [Chytridium lagenaria]|nr:thioredoxin-like protein [Chytridium lagenaria]
MFRSRVLAQALRPMRPPTAIPSARHFTVTASAKSDHVFVFNKENLERAKDIISKYPPQYKKGAIIPLLDLGQRQNGFTSISVMNHVAKLVEVPPMRVYEVATFYTMFNSLPTTPCALCGANEIVKTIEKHLDIHVECAGACSNAPVLAVNDDYYEDLTPETTIKSSRLTSEPITGLTSLTSEPTGPGFGVRADL